MLKFVVFICIFCLTLNIQAQNPYVLVLGVAQDGGYPQAGCNKACCANAWQNTLLKKHVACLAIVEPKTKKSWIIDATPDFAAQLQMLRKHLKDSTHLPSGILLTHAHIGHYVGLMQFGREVMGLKNMPVYVMPKMRDYLQENGPWSLLVKLKNIQLIDINNQISINLLPNISITPFLVPHRDEFSETVGYNIVLDKTQYVYIPDIDKWETFFNTMDKDSLRVKFEQQFLQTTNYLLMDGTFYKNGEISRNIKEVPHPFVEETISILKNSNYKNKVYFIHFNHTNPILKQEVDYKQVIMQGFNIAEEGIMLK